MNVKLICAAALIANCGILRSSFVRAQQSRPAASSQPAVMVAPAFNHLPSMTGQVGVPFRYPITTTHPRGTTDAPLSGFEATDLPSGLLVDAKTGVISGSPTTAGTFDVNMAASNSLGTAKSQLKLLIYSQYPTVATTIMRLKGTTESPFGYVEFLPKNYYAHPQQNFAVVIDLCGAGNISHKNSDPYGNNDQNKLWELTTQAGRTNLSGGTIFDDSDVIILSPIPPQWWENVHLDQFMSYAYRHYRIDRDRVYLVGLSAGGDGVLDYIAAHGGEFAGVVISAISHDNGKWTNFQTLPTWIFENWKDPFDGGKGDPEKRHSIRFCNQVATLLAPAEKPSDVLAGYPEPNIATVQPTQDYTAVFTPKAGWKWSPGLNGELGPPLRMTQCKTKNHGGWNQAYESPDVWKWLFAQRLKAQTIAPSTNGASSK